MKHTKVSQRISHEVNELVKDLYGDDNSLWEVLDPYASSKEEEIIYEGMIQGAKKEIEALIEDILKQEYS